MGCLASPEKVLDNEERSLGQKHSGVGRNRHTQVSYAQKERQPKTRKTTVIVLEAE